MRWIRDSVARMRISLFGLLVLASACQTQFTGSPHIEPAACQAKCAGIQMQMSGMIYMGEYSSACICELPKAAVGNLTPAAGGVAGAAAGVVMQMRREDERNQHDRRF